MLISLFLGTAVLVAVIVVGARRWQRNRLKYARPGTSIFSAIRVVGFDEIDAFVQEQRCAWCNHHLSESGETSRNAGDRRYRIVHLVCNECERPVVLFFDVTAIFH